MGKEEMKQLKDIAYIKKDHFIVDCCPDGVSDDKHNALRTFHKNHTFYLNIGILASTILDDTFYKFKCKKCNTEYKITEEALYDAIKKADGGTRTLE